MFSSATMPSSTAAVRELASELRTRLQLLAKLSPVMAATMRCCIGLLATSIPPTKLNVLAPSANAARRRSTRSSCLVSNRLAFTDSIFMINTIALVGNIVNSRLNKVLLTSGVYAWCAREDLNLHALRHLPLRQACLPFHHSR